MKHRTTVFGICSGRVNKSVVFFSEFLLEHSSKHMAEMLRASRLMMTETMKPEKEGPEPGLGKKEARRCPQAMLASRGPVPFLGATAGGGLALWRKGTQQGVLGGLPQTTNRKSFSSENWGGPESQCARKTAYKEDPQLLTKHHMCTYTSKVPRD